MTFERFLSVLRARWWVAATVLLLAVGMTFFVCLILPKSYTATASVLIDAKPDPLSAMIYGASSTPGFVATQIDVIQSDRVGTRVVRNLRLGENPQIRAQWQQETRGEGNVETWLSDAFRRNLEVVPAASAGSQIITLSYKAADPRFASAVVNAFVQAYIETSLELRVDPAKQYSTFFDTRSKEARESLEKAQAKLTNFQRDKGIIATDERLDVENTRLGELSTQLVALQALRSESGSRLAQANGSGADKMQEVLSNGVVSGLKADVARGEARLKELSSRLGSSHPTVVEATANVAELRDRMNAEIARVSGGVGVSNTINRQRESELRASLDTQRASLLRMKAIRDEGAVLVRDVDSAQRAYDAVTSRLTSTSLESQSTQSNAYALSQGTPPTNASFPKTGLSTLLAFFIGSLLAVATVLFLEMVDRRVRVGEDIVELLGLPVIGTIPKPVTKRLFGAKSDSKMQQRLMTQLPSAIKGA